MRQAAYFDWAVSTLFGWGVYGLNLLRHWPRVAQAPAYSLAKLHLESLAGMDPLGLRALAQSLVDSDALRLRLEAERDAKPLDGVVLHSLGNRFSGSTRPRQGGRTGRLTAGVIFFEETELPDAQAVARDYDVIVTGSTWCEEVLRANGVENARTVFQGIDPVLFHPGPRAGTLAGRFAVFSGGKLEYRKGQDLVLLAFRAFSQRHSDAVLVTSWHSPWASAALTVNENAALSPLALSAEGRIDPTTWAAVNGIAPGQFIDLGPIPNHSVGRVLREMDVAVFPNRCEGGTNLVAMECMACGIPTILADNTGQRDLVATGATLALSRQYNDGGKGNRVGWGESDVEEIVETLERVYRSRSDASLTGASGAHVMSGWCWSRQIGLLHDAVSAAS